MNPWKLWLRRPFRRYRILPAAMIIVAILWLMILFGHLVIDRIEVAPREETHTIDRP